MAFTNPNRTGSFKPNDVVMTNPNTAKWIVGHFNPSGLCLDPCAGENAFYNALPEPKKRLEIREGTDFFNFNDRVNWIISNPPYSIYDAFLIHAMEIADNIVWFTVLQKMFKSQKIDREIQKYGGVAKIILMGSGSKHGFPFGFPVGCLYFKRGYCGDIKLTRVYELWTK